MIDNQIKKYQQQSSQKFRNALTPKRFKSKRIENIAADVHELLEASADDASLILKLVRRNSEKRVREAAEWANKEPGKNKMRLFVQKLRELRTAGF